VPVEFLTDEQAAAYGRFVEEPTRPEQTWTRARCGGRWRPDIGPREEVMAASALLGELIGPADEEAEAEMRRLLATRYNTVRPFLSLLGESPALGAASGGKRILELKRLPALARRKVKQKPLLPREIDQ
jgi:hypothetical protein